MKNPNREAAVPRRRQPIQLEALAALQGPRLTLRKPQAEDAQAVFAYASDAEVTRFLAWPRHTSLADSECFLRRAVEGWKNAHRLVWLIEDEGGVVGAISAELSHSNAGVGYVLARGRWGRGYASEALGLLTAALFRLTPVETVWALCVTENVASQRVLEKSGFRYQRTHPSYLACPSRGSGMKDVFLYARAKRDTVSL
jgi:ribosomal-protein-alanine N-acetyltransferase